MVFQIVFLIAPAALLIGSYVLFRKEDHWSTKVLLLGAGVAFGGQMLQLAGGWLVEPISAPSGLLDGVVSYPKWFLALTSSANAIGTITFVTGFLAYAFWKRPTRSDA